MAEVPTKECSIGKRILGVMAVFATIFLFEWWFHGVFMMPFYQDTAELWRTAEEMQQHFAVSLIRVFVVAVVLVALYGRNQMVCCEQKCPVSSGMRFGGLIGLLLGIWDFGAYAWLPVPMLIPVYWFVGDVIMGLLIGVVLGLVLRTKQTD